MLKHKLTAVVLLLGVGAVSADDDDHGRMAKQDPTYVNECGECHLAYPPSLLSAQAWRGIMGSLGDHFGDNAELPQAERQRILAYLEQNAASGFRASIFASPGSENQARITQTRRFRHEHNEIPKRLWRDNEKVGSLANCEACHGDAKQWRFRERRINIPGYGAWDD